MTTYLIKYAPRWGIPSKKQFYCTLPSFHATLWPMKRWYKTLIGDTLILALCILALLFISKKTYSQGSGYVQIQASGGTYRYSLETNRTINVAGPLGDTIVVIEDGHAHIEDSPCPTKSCTQQKPIADPHTWIACLPNEVLLTIVGGPDQDMEVDDVSN